jgi:hypothetical protein
MNAESKTDVIVGLSLDIESVRVVKLLGIAIRSVLHQVGHIALA